MEEKSRIRGRHEKVTQSRTDCPVPAPVKTQVYDARRQAVLEIDDSFGFHQPVDTLLLEVNVGNIVVELSRDAAGVRCSPVRWSAAEHQFEVERAKICGHVLRGR